MADTVPGVGSVHRALRHVRGDNNQLPAFAMHLATPANCHLGRDVYLEDGRWFWRMATVPTSGDPVADAVHLMRRTHRPDDRYLDLDNGDPASWCKPGRYGARKLLAGADLLLGLPSIAGVPSVPDDVLIDVARLWLRDPRTTPPALHVDIEGRAWFIDGAEGWLSVRPEREWREP